ncbi:ABC-type antimicrobial peptide transport system, permease component [Parapedobacter luteus]|uniref:ABC-type antimicrobial peptide transport system, permease component n=1 Tax=Parapedobacter luteus TaxID=623280 RepID=A0A1T5FJD3_9SPHI|nr:ABC transporter permease [Parapedobacter luteus]SKB96314.1 ABC-type antimicrobial peptide transport system, permease component [Parapedobacter luteus]
MLTNYLKTAFRALAKHSAYSAINIFGLALSLSAAILILLWVWDELSYDRMHSKGNRIFQVSTTFDVTSENVWPVGPPPLAVFGQSELPSVEAACRMTNSEASISKPNDNRTFAESGQQVDPSFFHLFDFAWLAGNRQLPFPDNNSIVLTETLARKYFGHEEVLGQTVVLNLDPNNPDGKRNFRVTGVIADFPHNSSIEADFLLPIELLNENREGAGINEEWGSFSYRTFFLLQAGSTPKTVETQLADLHRKNNEAELFKTLVYFLQPLKDIHLYNGKGEERGMQQVRIFAWVALIILLIASINYVNLVTARSTRRSKEVSVRKVVGANRGHLFWQFITESVVVFFIAMCLSIGFAYAAMPLYNSLSGKEMVFSLSDSRVWLLFGGTLLSVVALAGIYPALLLSTFKPAQALKGVLPGIGKNNGFRKALVILQFTCSVVLIIATIIISRQLEYIRKKELGYDKENVFLFNQKNFLSRFEAVRTELVNQPGIKSVTAASGDISNIGSGTGDIEWEGKPASMANFMVYQMAVDHQFLDVMDLQLVEGHGFTGTPSDSGYVILNETAVRQMGLSDPVGKPITFRYRPVTIAGVVKDFHFADLKRTIAPCVLFADATVPLNGMYIKTTGAEAARAIAAVETLWKRYNAEFEFDYQFMDESFDKLYKSDIQAGRLFNVFAGIAILISCLGLFGLVTFTAETKVKEIGIRKTLGASVSHIILLISMDFLKLVGLSFLVAFPLGWWIMNKWLDNYVYRTGIEWWVFAVAGFTAFAIAAVTVCGKSLRAAQENPIKAIRTE